MSTEAVALILGSVVIIIIIVVNKMKGPPKNCTPTVPYLTSKDADKCCSDVIKGSWCITKQDNKGYLPGTGYCHGDQGFACKWGTAPPPPTGTGFNCVSNACTTPSTGVGKYSTKAACQSACGAAPPVIPTGASYNCVSNVCTSIAGTGGTYSTKAACQSACSTAPPPPTGTGFNCVSNACNTPSTGVGTYSTKAACQSACGANPPTPGNIPCSFQCKTDNDCPGSYCQISKSTGPYSCHGCTPNKPPAPAGSDWCQKKWTNTTDGKEATNCNAVGTCKAPHGVKCCAKSTSRWPNSDYPCKDPAQAAFCKEFVNSTDMNAMKNTKCSVKWFSCDYDTGKCGQCDPRTDPKCMALQQTKQSSCNSDCIKIPKYSCTQKPFTPWKLPWGVDDTWSTSEPGNKGGMTMWAEAAGPLGEGKNGVSPGLVQYYRGMAEFFCNQTLPCNRLQLRVENPYIDGAPNSTGKVMPLNSVKNIYYPAVTSPIYTELLKNLDPKIVVQFMPWTHEPWLAFKNEVQTTYSKIKVDGNCASSEIPCYNNDPTKPSIYGPVPECNDTKYPEIKNGDCWSTTDQKCVDGNGDSTCTTNQICARKTGQKWAECTTLCCDGKDPTLKPEVCDGGSICCGGSGDCPRVPTLAVILADMWNKFLENQTGYNGPFITGLAFDAEGSGYSASNLAKYSRNAIHSINGGKDYYKIPINKKSQHFIISVTQGSSFGGLIDNTLGVNTSGNPQKDKEGFLAFSTQLPDDLAKIKSRLVGVLTLGVEGAKTKTAPAIADEALPEYYNVIDKCDGGSPTLVDSLPNWKYPDFRDTKACQPNFNPYVGEQPYLWQPAGGKPGDTFQCGDAKIVASGCSSGGGPSPPTPTPTPTPTPGGGGKWCQHPSDCQSDEVCCNCNCEFGDADLGTYMCACDSITGKPLAADKQPTCCGGPQGFDAWCAKAGTASFAKPKCTSRTSTGVPTPANEIYPIGQHSRCVKTIDAGGSGCGAGSCDNPAPPSPEIRGMCNESVQESFTTSQCSNLPCSGDKSCSSKDYPCCGCGYSPSSIYLSAWNASDNKGTDASSILWDGTKNDEVFKQANLPQGVGPLKHFVTGAMSKGTNTSVAQFGVLRTCALLSIETSHGMDKADCLYPIFPVTSDSSSNMVANCGIPNAFGTWTGNEGKVGFVDICNKVQQGPITKIDVPFGSVGVFSYPLLPNSWLGNDFPYIPKLSEGYGSPTSGNKTLIWAIAGPIIIILLLLYIFNRRGSHLIGTPEFFIIIGGLTIVAAVLLTIFL